MSDRLLKRLDPRDVPALRRDPVDAQTLNEAATIVEAVREGGEDALRQQAERLGDIRADQPLIYGRAELSRALADLDAEQRALLERTAERIRTFAEQQRACLTPLETEIIGGRAGHDVAPVAAAGCYAPGGRFPLPSSVLMTALTARVAGVETVWVASPRPTPVTLAAAAVADANALLGVGGAQAIAALAYGAGRVPACDAVVGPGNRWVTAAKQLVAGRVAIDMLAGPSELVVLADDTASPEVIAADLLAQAEHDDDAVPILVSTSAPLCDEVEQALSRQLAELPTASTARYALRNGFTVLAPQLDQAIGVCNELAPEHLQIHVANPDAMRPELRHFGALFIGAGAAEVFGDYGIGPNHVLPTGGTARSVGGLSVLTFLRVRTWMRIDDGARASGVASDAAALARLEGLEAHARAAEQRG